jgi:8-oxo-dGTP pyrophosphatase MutT (NUDIX family)
MKTVNFKEIGNQYNCAGIVLFNDDFTKVILGATKKGHFSFPKGKREKGETVIDTAFRETFEETGISCDHIVINDTLMCEYKIKNGIPSPYCSVYYFIGKMTVPTNQVKIQFDEDELVDVKWYGIEDAHKLEGLHERRKYILTYATQYVKDNLDEINSTEKELKIQLS